MPKYNEHIDELDAFYQNSFEGGELQPPADMWDRIESSYEKVKGKEKTIPFYQKRNFWIITTAVIIILLFLFWFVKSNKNENGIKGNSNPVQNTEENKSTSLGTSEEEDVEKNNSNQESTSQGSNTSASQGNQKPMTDSNNNNPNKISQQNSVEASNTVEPVSVTTTEASQKPETLDTLSRAKENRKKKGFKDKYREALKDSTRPLFVPEKK